MLRTPQPLPPGHRVNPAQVPDRDTDLLRPPAGHTCCPKRPPPTPAVPSGVFANTHWPPLQAPAPDRKPHESRCHPHLSRLYVPGASTGPRMGPRGQQVRATVEGRRVPLPGDVEAPSDPENKTPAAPTR